MPVNLTGITLAGVTPFTSAAWTVTDGAIVTASTTSITIPVYPVGNQLSALALTVGLNLGIIAGDPIVISDTATGLNSMIGYVASYVPATGALIVQIGNTFQFEIRSQEPRGNFGDGYTTSWNVGTTNSCGPLLSASLGSGIMIVDLGVIQITIPEKTFKTLHSGTKRASMTMTDSVNTRELFAATLPVISGGVSA